MCLCDAGHVLTAHKLMLRAQLPELKFPCGDLSPPCTCCNSKVCLDLSDSSVLFYSSAGCLFALVLGC